MPLETLPLRGQMAEQKAEKEGEVAEEPIMSLSSDDSTSEIVALSPGGGAAQALTDEQIIACAVIGAKTGNATMAEMAVGRLILIIAIRSGVWRTLIDDSAPLTDQHID